MLISNQARLFTGDWLTWRHSVWRHLLSAFLGSILTLDNFSGKYCILTLLIPFWFVMKIDVWCTRFARFICPQLSLVLAIFISFLWTHTDWYALLYSSLELILWHQLLLRQKLACWNLHNKWVVQTSKLDENIIYQLQKKSTDLSFTSVALSLTQQWYWCLINPFNYPN